MSENYYQRNLDQLYCGTQLQPRNGVLDVVLSDVGSVTDESLGIGTYVYTAIGGETDFQNDVLINATIINVSRDGLNYTPVDEFSADAGKEYTFDSDTGTITYHPGLPPMNPPPPKEDNIVTYIIAGGLTPGAEPVTLEQAKDWLKVEVDDDDAIIESLITAARLVCEGYVALSFVTRTVTAVLNNGLGNIRLPYGPVNEITSATDISGGAIGSYTITGIANKRLLEPKTNYIQLVYSAGYVGLPKHFKTAILTQLTRMYQHRGDDSITDIAPDAKIILKPHRAHT